MKYLIIFLLSITTLLSFPSSSQAQEGLYTPPEKTKEELFYDLFISMLLPEIDKAVDGYYSGIITESPVVYPYSVYLVNAKRIYGYRSFKFRVTLQVNPVVGPHIEVGKDQLTFIIGAGRVRLINFQHLKTAELPPHWQHIIK